MMSSLSLRDESSHGNFFPEQAGLICVEDLLQYIPILLVELHELIRERFSCLMVHSGTLTCDLDIVETVTLLEAVKPSPSGVEGTGATCTHITPNRITHACSTTYASQMIVHVLCLITNQMSALRQALRQVALATPCLYASAVLHVA